MKVQRELLGILLMVCTLRMTAQEREPLPDPLLMLKPIEVFNSDKVVTTNLADGRANVSRSILKVQDNIQGLSLIHI